MICYENTNIKISAATLFSGKIEFKGKKSLNSSKRVILY